MSARPWKPIVALTIVSACRVVSPADHQSPASTSPSLASSDMQYPLSDSALASAPSTIAELQAAATKLMAANKAAAGIAIVHRDSVIWAGGIGDADATTRAPVTAETHFRVASITKTFTALAVMQQVEAGRVSLQDRVATLAPDVAFENPWEQTDPVRLEHLFRHSTGFSQTTIGTDGRDRSLAEALQLARRSRVSRWRPGTTERYINGDVVVAGRVLERLTNARWDSAITVGVLRPLGMNSSGFGPAPAPLPRAVPVDDREQDILEGPAANMHSSPAEMARMLRMFLNRGSLDGQKVLSPESIQAMEAATNGTNDLTGYGLGVYRFPRFPGAWYQHEGGGYGTASRFAYSPEAGVGYFVAVAQRPTKALRSLDELMVAFLTKAYNLPSPPQRPRVEVSPAELAALSGNYRITNPYGQKSLFADVTLAVNNGTLNETDSTGATVELIPVSDHEFRTAAQWHASRFVLTSADGTKDVRIGGNVLERTRLPRISRSVMDSSVQVLAIVALSTILFALVWIPRTLLRRLPEGIRLLARAAPLMGAVALLIAIDGTEFVSLEASNSDAGYWTQYVLSAAAGAFGLAGLALVVRYWKGRVGNMAVRLHTLAASLSVVLLSLFAIRML